MFRRIAGTLPAEGNIPLFQIHPVRIAALMEFYWNGRAQVETEQLGHPDNRSNLDGLPQSYLDLFGVNDLLIDPNYTSQISPPFGIHHLIYAYMIQSTMVYEIFEKVIFEFRHGEKLGTLSSDARNWLRITENLFYKDAPDFFIFSLTSHVRPDLRKIALNAYDRMFGWTLPYKGKNGEPFTYVKANAANKQFLYKFQEFLRGTWVAITNINNSTGSNPTDFAQLANHGKDLYDMLRDTREGGNISPEEFALVSMFSWFHLTLEFNSPIVVDLKAEATSFSQRLLSIGERVGLSPHPKSEAFSRLAEPLSTILTEIERRTFNTVDGVSEIVNRPAPDTIGDFERDLRTIIANWSEATGQNLKARPLASNQPLSLINNGKATPVLT